MSSKTGRELLKQSGWGVFVHYLAGLAGAPAADAGAGVTSAEWNRRVDSFDVQGLATQLSSVGAKYCFITLGQNSGHYCSPNSTYDSIVGISPSKCSKRDLVSDLYDALEPKDIKLFVYFPSTAPACDPVAMEKLQWEWGLEGKWGDHNENAKKTGKRLAEFQIKWEAVAREWSLRWGKKVCGWWVDGLYFADEMYNHDDAPNFKSFTGALRAGNSGSMVALNAGVSMKIDALSQYDDLTAGELDTFLYLGERKGVYVDFPEKYKGGPQFHLLTFLGATWGAGKPRFPGELVIGYTKYIKSHGGAITYDVPTSVDGLIPDDFMDQLAALNKGLSK